MKQVVLLLLALAPSAATTAVADVVGPGGKTIDCFCTDSRGARVELGEKICLYVDGRAFMATCEMSLNNPIWRDTGDGCLSSESRPAMSPKPAANG